MSVGDWHVALDPPPPAPPPSPPSPLCGETLAGRAARARFCSAACRVKASKLRDYLAGDATADWSLAHQLGRADGDAIVRTLRNAGLQHDRAKTAAAGHKAGRRQTLEAPKGEAKASRPADNAPRGAASAKTACPKARESRSGSDPARQPHRRRRLPDFTTNSGAGARIADPLRPAPYGHAALKPQP